MFGIADVDPQPRLVHFAFGLKRKLRVVRVDHFSVHDLLAHALHQRLKHLGAFADPTPKR